MTTLLRPPGSKGKPLVGSLFDFFHDRIGFLSKVVRDYGDIVYFKLGPWKVFLLNHPDFIKVEDAPCAGHRVELQPFITLRPIYGMRMTLERR